MHFLTNNEISRFAGLLRVLKQSWETVCNAVRWKEISDSIAFCPMLCLISYVSAFSDLLVPYFLFLVTKPDVVVSTGSCTLPGYDFNLHFTKIMSRVLT